MGRLKVMVVGSGVAGVSVARALLRDGHHVTVFEQRQDVSVGDGAVTIWPNGATVLRHLGVDMETAGQVLSTVRVLTSSGRRLAALDVTAVGDRLGAPVRTVPRRVLLERLLHGFPASRIRCDARAVEVVRAPDGVRVRLDDGTIAEGDILIGADGVHSMVRTVVGAAAPQCTGWCSWQGLVTLADIPDDRVAQIIVGQQGNLGLWPAGGSELQYWFDLPWSSERVRPLRPVEAMRSQFTGWSELADRVLATLTDDDLARSPFPHFRQSIPSLSGQGAVTLVGDAAHTMPPTFAQGTNQALLDTMVLRKALSHLQHRRGVDAVSGALRWYEDTRRRSVAAVSRVAAMHVSRSEAMLRPAAMIPDRVSNWALTTFLRSTSHRRLSASPGFSPPRRPLRLLPAVNQQL
jgi:FAD-dependent urate hydroxylase